jgi:hypothetical protein
MGSPSEGSAMSALRLSEIVIWASVGAAAAMNFFSAYKLPGKHEWGMLINGGISIGYVCAHKDITEGECIRALEKAKLAVDAQP